MTVRRFLLLALVGVLAGVAAWLPTRLGGTESGAAASPHGATSAGSHDAPDVAPSAAPPGSPSGSAAARPSARTSSPVPGQSPSHSGGGSEILPQPSSTATQTGLPLPKRPPQGPLVSSPLPRAAYTKGGIVAGYPTALRPPRRSTIETSSVSPANDTLQVALTARCIRCDVLGHFRTTLGARGFHEVDTVSVANTPAAALQRGKDTINVTVVAEHGRTVEYAVLAILHVEA